MAARKRKSKKTARKKAAKKVDVFEKMLSGSKVKRILDNMEADTDGFAKAYEQDTGRSTRGIQTPEDYEIDAVDAFQKSGDLTALMKSLETENRQTALATVGRVLGWKAKE